MGGIPKFFTVFGFDLRLGGMVFAGYEMTLGVIGIISGIVSCTTPFGSLTRVPQSVWILIIIINVVRLVAYLSFLYGIKSSKRYFLIPALVVAVSDIFFIIPFMSLIVKVLTLYEGSSPDADVLPENSEWHFLYCITVFAAIGLKMYLYAVQFTIYKLMKKGLLTRRQQPIESASESENHR